jgi:opacity protein-like surface antigen
MKLHRNILCSVLSIAVLFGISLSRAVFADELATDEQRAIYAPQDRDNAELSSEDAYMAYPQPISKIRNLYFGAKFGIDNANIKHKISNNIELDQSTALGNNGFLVGFFLGVCNSYDAFYIAMEGQASMSTLENKTTSSGYDMTVKTPALFSLDLKPGYLISDNIAFYGLIGVSLSQLKVDVDLPEVFSLNSFVKTLAGLRFGIGLEDYLSKNVSINADYVYTVYSAANNSFTNKTSGIVYSHEFSMATNQVSVGLAYHF